MRAAAWTTCCGEVEESKDSVEFVSFAALDHKGSHGYLEHVFVASARQLFGVDVQRHQLRYKTLRNEDVEELTLTLSAQQRQRLPFALKDAPMRRTGRVLRFLRCFGFRNIQNLVRRLEKGKSSSKYHYVEVMACPSGCLNGGGQIRKMNKDGGRMDMASQKAHMKGMRELLLKAQLIRRIDTSVGAQTKRLPMAEAVHAQMLKCAVGESELLRMTLKHVGDAKAKLNTKW